MRTINWFIPSVVAFMLIGSFCLGRVITVDDDGPADFDNIQAAIDDSNNGDTIEVQPGTYTGPGNRDIDLNGKAIIIRSTDPNDPNTVAATVIDCENAGRGFYFHNAEDANSILAGLTITNGVASDGGGIYCTGWVSPTITNCTITGNMALRWGGGIFCIGWSSPTITNCILWDNTPEEVFVFTILGFVITDIFTGFIGFILSLTETKKRSMMPAF